MSRRQVAVVPMRIEERAELAADGQRLEFRIQRILRSPNTYLGRHWREKNRERCQWQAHFVNALALSCPPLVLRSLVSSAILPGGQGQCTTRRRVTVTRVAPSARRFIHDDDNLRFAVKPILDALKHVGLIHDDHRKWIDLPSPEQTVSTDGCFWTHVVITPAPAVEATTPVVDALQRALRQVTGR